MFFDVNGVQPSTSTWNTSPPTFGNHYRNESKTSVCRLCANVRDIMHPIYENKEQQWNISEKINKYLPVVVSPSDQLSQTICGSCLQMLIAWDQFTQQCAEVDIKLRKEARAVPQKVEQITTTSTNDSNDTSSLAVRPAVVSRDGRGRRRAACGACGAVVALAGWRRHVRRHAAQGAGTACAHCGRVFSEAGNLARHVRARHGSGARPHVCPDCGRAFSRAEHLREHAALHSTTRAFLCSVCGLSCRSAAALRVHGAVHVRRHGCTSCGAVFARASQLANHSRRARCTRTTRPPAILEETEVGAAGGGAGDAGAGRGDDEEGYAAPGTLPDLDDYFDYFS